MNICENFCANLAETESKFGAIGVFGRANAGKSTLVNVLVGEKVSIVSNRPQTTRRRILGILTKGNSQVVFCDTPGLHPIKNKLDAFMSREIEATTQGLQGALYLVDVSNAKIDEDETYLCKLQEQLGREIPLYLVFNKIDAALKTDRVALEEKYLKIASFAGVFNISAVKGIGIPQLQNTVFNLLVPGPHAYDDELFTSQSEREIVEETIREVILENYRHEVPHSVAVTVEQFKERPQGKTFIDVNLVVERESHKKIIIGRQGAGLKNVGIIARERLNTILGRDIYLQLWIKVRRNWRKQEVWVRRLGYCDR